MKPEHLKKAGRELGLRPKDFAGVLGVPDTDAIRLWSEGGAPIPGPIANRIHHLLTDWRRARKVAKRVVEERVKPKLCANGNGLDMGNGQGNGQGNGLDRSNGQDQGNGQGNGNGNEEDPKVIGLTLYDQQSIKRLMAEEPGVTLAMHNLVNRAMVMALADLGICARLTLIEEGPYTAWLGDRPCNKAMRAEYARDVAKGHTLGLPPSNTPLGEAIIRLRDLPSTLARLGLQA